MVQVDAFEAVVTRIEVRDFSPKEVPNEVKMKVLEAGRMAPSAWNKQPWHFVLVDDKQELAKLASLSQTGGYIKGAAFAVAVLIDKSYPQYNTDAIRCVQGILIAAWGLGLGSCFVGVIDREKVKELLGAPPELHLVTILPFGYTRKTFKGKKDRKPLKDMASHNRFGVPLE